MVLYVRRSYAKCIEVQRRPSNARANSPSLFGTRTRRVVVLLLLSAVLSLDFRLFGRPMPASVGITATSLLNPNGDVLA